MPAQRTFDSDTHHDRHPLRRGRVDCATQVEGAGATFFTVLLAGFATLLMRYSGQEDFVIGSVITRRPPEVKSLLGFFINSLALRTEPGGQPNLLRFRRPCARNRLRRSRAWRLSVSATRRGDAPKAGRQQQPLCASLLEHAEFMGSGRSLRCRPLDPPARRGSTCICRWTCSRFSRPSLRDSST